jgi:hypothetical protein
MVTGPSAGVIITLIFALISILLGFWAGLIIGPAIAFIAALVPERN